MCAVRTEDQDAVLRDRIEQLLTVFYLMKRTHEVASLHSYAGECEVQVRLLAKELFRDG